MLQGRREEAYAALKKYREGKFTEAEIAEEYNLLQLGIAHEHEKGKFIELFKGTHVARTLITICANFLLQSTGQAFAVSYGAVYVKSLNTVNPFYITLVWNLSNIAFGLVAMALMDRIGRR
jgi:SP family sugar:H+ symporter-like MFS transporter